MYFLNEIIRGASNTPACSTTGFNSDYYLYCLDPCVTTISCGYCAKKLTPNELPNFCGDLVYSVTIPMPSVNFLDDIQMISTCEDMSVYPCGNNGDATTDFRENQNLLLKNYIENLDYIYSGGSVNNVPNNLTTLYNFFGGFNTMYYKGKLRNVNFKWYRPLVFYPQYESTTTCVGSPKLSTIFGTSLTGFTYLPMVDNISLAPTPSVAGKLIRTTGVIKTTYFWNPLTSTWVNIYSVSDCVAPKLLILFNAMSTNRIILTNRKRDIILGINNYIFTTLSAISFQFGKFKNYSFPSLASICGTLYESPNPNNTPATIDEPLKFDICPQVGSTVMLLSKTFNTSLIVKANNGFCYTLNETAPASTSTTGMNVLSLVSTHVNCTTCNPISNFLSINTISDCNKNVNYDNYATTSMVYRVNGGSWVTINNTISNNNTGCVGCSGYQEVPVYIPVTVGTVIEIYFPGIRWGVGYLSGDYTSRCDNQPYTITISTTNPFSSSDMVVNTAYYFNLKSKVTTGSTPPFATTCGFQECPSYPTPRPWRWNLYDWGLATPYYLWSDSSGLYNTKDYYTLKNRTYTSVSSYVWYEPVDTTWYNTPVLGDTNIIYSSLVSADSDYPVSSASNNWFSTSETYPSILSSEPQSQINMVGLIAWLDVNSDLSWPGSGNVWFDITDNNNDGTFRQSSSPTQPIYSPGVGGSFSFNGSNQKFTIPPSVTLSAITNTVSVEVWLRPTLFNDREIVCQSSNSGYRARLDSLGRIWMLGAYDSGPLNYTYTSTGTTTLNQWNQVVMVWSPSGYYTYINGQNSGYNSSYTLNVQLFNQTMDIGCFTGNLPQFHYQGDMSIVRIYNRVLTSDEVLSNFNSQKDRFGL